MKNVILFILTLLNISLALAQDIEIKGVVKDAASNEPVTHVSISDERKQYNTISNTDGAFTLTCPAGTNKIILSSIGYQHTEVNTGNLPSNGVFLLEPKAFELDEIIIINIPINELVDDLIKTSYNKLNSTQVLTTYYREFVKINDRYTKFSDALIDYNVQKKKKEIEAPPVVKQSRAVKLDIENEAEIDMTSPLDVRKAVSRDCNFKPLDAVFSKKEFKKYNFTIKSQAGNTGQNLQAIFFVPKPDIEEPLFEGNLVYDADTDLIIAVNMHMADSHKKNSKLRNFIIVKARLDDIYYKSIFSSTAERYTLAYSCIGGDVYLKNKKKYDDHIIFKSDLNVTGFSNDISSYNKKEKYNERGLYSRGNNYKDKFWLNSNSIQLTSQEENIIKSIENK